MKILYISHLHPPKNAVLKNIGGMQRVSMQLTEVLSQHNKCELAEITQETGWRFIGIKTTFFLIRLFFLLPHYVKKHKADVILFSSMVTASVSHFTRNRISIPMVSISHGHDVTLTNPMYQWLVPKIFKALNACISVSSATQQECLRRGLDVSKSNVLPNGFDVKDLTNIPPKEEALFYIEQTFGVKLEGKKLLITVGRLIKRKGHEWFIREVLPLIESDVLYLIIGDGPEFNAINKAKSDSIVNDNILIAGRQPDEMLQYAYAGADLFVMPNIKVPGDMEGFGVVLLEANVRQTPAIASDLEGIKDVIVDGKNGYKIAVNDAKAFAKKIDEVIQKELPSLSLSSKSFAESKFNWIQVGESYYDYLRKIASK